MLDVGFLAESAGPGPRPLKPVRARGSLAAWSSEYSKAAAGGEKTRTPFGVLLLQDFAAARLGMTLRGGALRECHAAQGGTQDVLHVIDRAHVAGAGLHGGNPQLLIWNAIGAHNRQ